MLREKNLLCNGNGYSIGLIVTPQIKEGMGWSSLEIHPWVAWVSGRSGGSQVVTIQAARLA